MEEKKLLNQELNNVSGGEQLSSKVTVPDVIGKTFVDAKSELENTGFRVDSKYDNSSQLLDTVLLSDPLPGMSVEKGTKIVLTLSNARG